MKNRDVFYRDPVIHSIPNNGVAKVLIPRTAQEWEIIKYELSSFVCEGEYHRGLERVLRTYLDSLAKAEQPAVWVSGFYGSGKSHLVRVLEYLWRDTVFPDGARARGIVRDLPDDIKEDLVELTNAGRREGGLWSAAGTLGAGAGDSIRLALLSILFRSAELPEQYAPARFVLWLKQNGYYDTVKAAVESEGSSLEEELNDLYVSPPLAQGVMEAYPGFASSLPDAHNRIQAQWPTRSDISDDEMLGAMEDVLELQSNTPGRLPCTLIICDELQQFIGDSPNHSLQVQNVVESCCSRFGSRLLFVATGQSALQATPQLQKLQGRFAVRVQLQDRDVDQVVREVVLRKKQDRISELQSVLSSDRGEIDRELAGTAIGPKGADADDLIPDYPLLPARRRFWESVMRAVDSSGASGQLRTQLRIVHEAAREVAEEPLGTVIAADSIYNQLKTDMLQSSVLLRETHDFIEEQRSDGTPNGELRARLCATIFLINKLPTEGVEPSGLKANQNTLTDLLVADLRTDRAELQQRIPRLLDELVEASKLLKVDGEYRLQTRESSEWDLDYRKHLASVSSDEGRISSDRAEALRAAFTQALKGIALKQGDSGEPRKYDLDFGQETPRTNTGSVPVWVRDGWTISEKVVRDDAQQAGVESSIVFVFLPRINSDALKDAIARYAAANATLNLRPAPTTPEGQEARRAMESRREDASRALDTRVREVVERARVFQGGGNEVAEGSLQASIKRALEDALQRLFPNFGIADNPRWDLVFRRARDGAADALAAVGYSGDADKHSVSKAIADFVGGMGKKGSEVRKQFMGPGYGWPQDAVDACLLVLVQGDVLEAKQNAQAVTPAAITRQNIGATEFRRTTYTVSVVQRIAVRKLLQDVGISVSNGEEPAAVPRLIEQLIALAKEAGGEPPLPEHPSVSTLEHLRSLTGNEQFVEVYNHKDELLRNHNKWTVRRSLIQQRDPQWQELLQLQDHAHGLPVAEHVTQQIEGIRSNRSLLENPDPVPPLATELAGALRFALQQARQYLEEVRSREVSRLESSGEWHRLPKNERERLLRGHGLDSVPNLEVGTNAALIRALNDTPLSDWKDKADALPIRATRAREEAVKLLEPKAVPLQIPHRTLTKKAEAEEYLEELRSQIMSHLDAGNPVIL